MTSALVVQLILGGFGVSGIIGAGVALYKLRPDVNSAAVTQAQGAMESLDLLNDELKEERTYWRDRALAAERELEELRREMRGRTHS